MRRLAQILLVLFLPFPASLLAADDPVPENRPLLAARSIHQGGARPDWSAQGDRIAFDAAGADGRHDIHLMEAPNGHVTCLTCEIYDLRKRNNLNPAWHPSGDFLLVQVQGLARRLDLGSAELATPDRGAHTELFVVRADGKDFYQLTRETGMMLDPHFSHEGNQLVWSERLGTTRGSRWGQWTLRLAGFQGSGKFPRIRRVRSFQPGEQKGLIVTHGFTPNDNSFLLSANLEAGQPESGSDIYLFDIETRGLERLTHTRGSWDVHAHVSPRGDRIAWTTNTEILEPPAKSTLPAYLLRDLWLMNRDGSDKQRLTYFNHPGSQESLEGGAYVGDFSWSPQGDQIVVHVIPGSAMAGEGLYLLQLGAEFRR